mgnify:CR=1 FL=1
MVSLTRCLVVRAIQTHRLFHNEAKATDLESLSIIGLLAEIVQKRADYRLVIQMVCLLRLCIRIPQIKLRHSLRKFSP